MKKKHSQALILLCFIFLSQLLMARTANSMFLQQSTFSDAFISNIVILLTSLTGVGLILFSFSQAIPNINPEGGRIIPVDFKQGAAQTSPTAAPLITASVVIGFGMGGTLDSIFLRQILQWHQMISGILPPTTVLTKNVNMFWDGISEAFSWAVTMIGIILLYNLLKRENVIRSTSIFVGGLISGWGFFIFFDSIFNHYIFKFHNVRENAVTPEFWNVLFLTFSIIFMLLGWLLIQTGIQTWKKNNFNQINNNMN